MKIHSPSWGTPLEDFPASSVATGPHHGQWSRRKTYVASWPVITSHRHFSKFLPLLLMDADGGEVVGMEEAKNRSPGSWMTTWGSTVSPGWTPTQHYHVGKSAVLLKFWVIWWFSINYYTHKNVNHTAAAAAKSLQSYPTLCNPRDGSPPGSPVPGILQVRTLEWIAT